ncbi:MAG: DUF2155 domain-containing protein [Pseudomonadota bacterium]
MATVALLWAASGSMMASAQSAAGGGELTFDPRTGEPILADPADPIPEPAPARPSAPVAAPPAPAEERRVITGETTPAAPALGAPDIAAPEVNVDAFTPENFEPGELDLGGLNLDGLEGLERGPSSAIPEAPPAPPVAGVEVSLKAVDKLTGDVTDAVARVGGGATIWRLEIDVKACYARPEASQSAAGSAFLQIRDTKFEPAQTVFSGWMFAASPALSAMDHPRYDVWVLSCTIS